LLAETVVAAVLAPLHILVMSTMAEIQRAIEGLPASEKKALSAWLSSQQEPEMSPQEEAALLAALDKAARQLDAGLGVPLEQARGMVQRWASK
jgi:hypothetical protein